MRLVAIPPEHVEAVWPMVAGWLAKAAERDGRHGASDVLARCQRAQATLWVAWDGRPWAGVVTEVYEFPLASELHIWLCGGEERKRWVRTVIETLEAYGRRIGARRLTIAGRKGWLRELPDFEATHMVLTKELP